MINVTILAFDYVLPAALMGINDLLYYAGRAEQNGGQRRFAVRIASWDGQPVTPAATQNPPLMVTSKSPT